jgi:hypothetical protein
MHSDATLIPGAGLVVMTVDGRPLTSRLVQMQRPGTPVFVEPGQHEIEMAHCDRRVVPGQGPTTLGELVAMPVLKVVAAAMEAAMEAAGADPPQPRVCVSVSMQAELVPDTTYTVTSNLPLSKNAVIREWRIDLVREGDGSLVATAHHEAETP